MSVADASASCVFLASLPTKFPYVAATHTSTGTVPIMSSVSFHDMASITMRAPTMVAEKRRPMEMLVVTAFFNTSVSDANRFTSSPDFVVSKKPTSCIIKCENKRLRILTTTRSPAKLYSQPRTMANKPPIASDEKSRIAAICSVISLRLSRSAAVAFRDSGALSMKRRTTVRPGPTTTRVSSPSDSESMIAPKNMGTVSPRPAAKKRQIVATTRIGISCFACERSLEMEGIFLGSAASFSSVLPSPPPRFRVDREGPEVDMGRED